MAKTRKAFFHRA